MLIVSILFLAVKLPQITDDLIEGLDDISLTLNNTTKIESFEKKMRNLKPWMSK